MRDGTTDRYYVAHARNQYVRRNYHKALLASPHWIVIGNDSNTEAYLSLTLGSMDFRNTKLSMRRSVLSYSKAQALISWFIRGRRPFVRRKFATYLNLGCGANIYDGFVNLDFYWRPGIDICWDLAYGIPLASASIAGCFTEHCLEHLELDVGIQTLKEIYRILLKGGIVRIVVPDPEIYIDAFIAHRKGKAVSIPYATPEAEPTPMMSINRVFRNFEHKYAWDFETLKFFLEKTGFASVEKKAFGCGSDECLIIDSRERQIESLYVEAIKP